MAEIGRICDTFQVKPMKKKGKDKGEEGTNYHPPGDFGESPDGSSDEEGPSGPPGSGPPDNGGPGGPGGPGYPEPGLFPDYQGPTEIMQLKIPMPERFDGDKDKLDKFMLSRFSPFSLISSKFEAPKHLFKS